MCEGAVVELLEDAAEVQGEPAQRKNHHQAKDRFRNLTPLQHPHTRAHTHKHTHHSNTRSPANDSERHTMTRTYQITFSKWLFVAMVTINKPPSLGHRHGQAW